MIEKFISAAGEIRLRNRKKFSQNMVSKPEETIFDVDSLSLIIGENGSGKTRILEGMAEAICLPRRKGWGREWEPRMFSDASALSKCGVVYFSQAPNRRKRKEKLPHYVDAFSSRPRGYSPEVLFDHEDLLQEFTDIDARFIASLRADVPGILRLLVSMMLQYNATVPSECAREFADLERAFKQSRAELVPEDSYSEDDWKALLRDADPTFDTQADFFAKELGETIFADAPGKTFAAMAVLDHMLNMERCPRVFLLEAFSSFTGIRFGRKKVGEDIKEQLAKFHRYQKLVASLLKRAGIGETELLMPRWPESIRVSFKVETRVQAEGISKGPLSEMVDLEWSNVSAGQWALVTQCIEIDRAIQDLTKKGNIQGILVLIDEGDAFLHLEWQRKYIYLMNKLLFKIKKRTKKNHPGFEYLQVVIATHSPLLATDVPASYVNRVENRVVVEPSASFAAPLQTLLNNSFKSKSIGEHAAHTIRETVNSLRNQTQPSDRDLYVIEAIDDPIIRRELESIAARKIRGIA